MCARLAPLLLLPVALAACPAFLSDWTIRGGTGDDASMGTGSSTGAQAGASSDGGSELGSSGASDAPSSGSSSGSSSSGDATSSDGDTGAVPEEADSHVVRPDADLDAPSVADVVTDANAGNGGCANAAVQCSRAQPAQRQICVSGVWVDNGAACSGSTPVCLSGACVECTSGAKQCGAGTQPQLCVDAGWVDQGSACSGNTPVCLNGACNECSPGATQCAGGTQPQSCVSGVWTNNGSPVTHSNGVGQTWQDCAPLGTYDHGQAMKACAAYAGDVTKCLDGGGCGAGTGIVYTIVGSNEYIWGYAGFVAGYVSSSGSCPTSSDSQWK